MARANVPDNTNEVARVGPDTPAEVKLQLNRAGVEQVLSLYAERRTDAASELTLDDVLRALRSRWHWLMVGALVGIGLSALFVLVSTPVYPLAAKVIIERYDADGLPRPAGSAYVATQAQLMASTQVLDVATSELPAPRHLGPDDSALLDALERISASPISGTEVISLGYLGPDPEYGRQLIHATFDAYQAQLRMAGQRKAENARQSKEREIASLRARAADIEAEIAATRAANGLVGDADDAIETQRRLLADQVEELSTVRNERLQLENQLAVGRSDLSLTDPETRALREELRTAENELERLELTLTREHPSVASAARTVSVLRRQLQRTAQSTPDALRRDIEILTGQEADLAAIEGESRERLAEIEAVRRTEVTQLETLNRIRALIAERERALQDEQLELLLASSGAQDGSSASMIVEPTLPDAPAWPKPMLMTGAGGTLGAGLALLLATQFTRRDRSDLQQQRLRR